MGNHVTAMQPRCCRLVVVAVLVFFSIDGVLNPVSAAVIDTQKSAEDQQQALQLTSSTNSNTNTGASNTDPGSRWRAVIEGVQVAGASSGSLPVFSNSTLKNTTKSGLLSLQNMSAAYDQYKSLEKGCSNANTTCVYTGNKDENYEFLGAVGTCLLVMLGILVGSKRVTGTIQGYFFHLVAGLGFGRVSEVTYDRLKPENRDSGDNAHDEPLVQVPTPLEEMKLGVVQSATQQQQPQEQQQPAADTTTTQDLEKTDDKQDSQQQDKPPQGDDSQQQDSNQQKAHVGADDDDDGNTKHESTKAVDSSSKDNDGKDAPKKASAIDRAINGLGRFASIMLESLRTRDNKLKVNLVTALVIVCTSLLQSSAEDSGMDSENSEIVFGFGFRLTFTLLGVLGVMGRLGTQKFTSGSFLLIAGAYFVVSLIQLILKYSGVAVLSYALNMGGTNMIHPPNMFILSHVSDFFLQQFFTNLLTVHWVLSDHIWTNIDADRKKTLSVLLFLAATIGFFWMVTRHLRNLSIVSVCAADWNRLISTGNYLCSLHTHRTMALCRSHCNHKDMSDEAMCVWFDRAKGIRDSTIYEACPAIEPATTIHPTKNTALFFVMLLMVVLTFGGFVPGLRGLSWANIAYHHSHEAKGDGMFDEPSVDSDSDMDDDDMVLGSNRISDDLGEQAIKDDAEADKLNESGLSGLLLDGPKRQRFSLAGRSGEVHRRG